MDRKKIMLWVLNLFIVISLARTLPYKLSAHESSVALFSALGVEPYGRIFVGLLEAITVIMILFPQTHLIGVFLSIGLMLGAIFSHALFIGIVFEGSYALFLSAVSILIAGLCILIIKKDKVALLLDKYVRR